MAKKNKGVKLKQYKVPPEKFLVVVNPWGVYEKFDNADLNHVAAWFEVMLRDEHPDTQVRGIYYQRTHRNIIVELPKEVQIEEYLGAHHYSKFFKGPGISDEIAYIYEYKYATFGNPCEKNFVLGHASYNEIPADFPIQYPYPLPSPAPPPPMDVPYARAIPQEINDKLAANHAARPAHAGPNSEVPPPTQPSGPASTSKNRMGSSGDVPSSSSRVGESDPFPTRIDDGKGKERAANTPPQAASTGAFTPYVRPSHLNSTLTDRINNEPRRGEEATRQYDTEAHSFLTSLLTSVETEDVETKVEPYEPSADLLEALGSLPTDLRAEDAAARVHPIVKTEPMEPELSDYDPSDELLAALATIPDLSHPSDFGARVKEEPRDPILNFGLNESIPGPSNAMKQYRNLEGESRATGFRSNVPATPRQKRHIDRDIKQEEVEFSPPKRIKTEQ